MLETAAQGPMSPLGFLHFRRLAAAAEEDPSVTDDEFLRAFFELDLPSSGFHHRDHLRLAWLVVRRDGGGAARALVSAGIRRFAAAHGHAGRYHETLTAFWVRIVAHAVSRHPEIDDFDRFLGAHPLLMDARLPLRHWSRDALFGAAARAAWREPDLVPLPF
jgi:hypothetical protein